MKRTLIPHEKASKRGNFVVHLNAWVKAVSLVLLVLAAIHPVSAATVQNSKSIAFVTTLPSYFPNVESYLNK